VLDKCAIENQLLQTQVIALLGRDTLLGICSIGGILSIYLGWSLYKSAILGAVAGEGRIGALTLRLTAAGPGVFFAIFGMFILHSIVQQRLELIPTKPNANENATPTSLSYYSMPLDLTDPQPFLKTTDGPSAPKKNAHPCPHCLVPMLTIRQLGGDSVTRPSLKEALSTAILELRRIQERRAPSVDIGDQMKRTDSIQLLEVVTRALEKQDD
jgi:hypothetical protein